MSTDERRERYASAIWQAVKADMSDPSEGPDAYLNALADVAMAVADAELLDVQRELTSSKAAHRAVWDKHQERGQMIFDLQGEIARLRSELAELTRGNPACQSEKWRLDDGLPKRIHMNEVEQ